MLATGDRIQFKQVFDEDIEKIEADKDQLDIAISNIVDNAVQSIEKKGVITIYVKTLDDIDSQNKGLFRKSIEIEITDTGDGIEDKNMDKVREPFFTSKKGGTGLGLAISNKIIGSHNGRLEIFSKKGLGTRVSIILPEKQNS